MKTTNNIGLQDMVALALNGGSWQKFIDLYETQFNVDSVADFKFDPVSISYTFNQLIKSVHATVLPTYVDPESEGFEMPLGETQGLSDNIPTQKLYYSVNRVILREQMQLAQRFGKLALDEQLRGTMFDLLDEGTTGLIQAFWNALNHQRDQIVSTGSFTIDATNNPRGIKGVTIGFGIPSSHITSLTDDNKWWTNASHVVGNEGSTSDPIKSLADEVTKIRKTFHYVGKLKMELSQILWDDLLTHTAVLKQIGYSLYPTAADANAALSVGRNTDDDRKKETIRKLIKVDEIVTKESYSFVAKPGTKNGSPDLVTDTVENFKKENIAFMPVGNLGTIQGVQPLSMGYDAADIAYAMDKRLLIEQERVPRSHSININGEMAQICVPSAVNQMFIKTVTV